MVENFADRQAPEPIEPKVRPEYTVDSGPDRGEPHGEEEFGERTLGPGSDADGGRILGHPERGTPKTITEIEGEFVGEVTIEPYESSELAEPEEDDKARVEAATEEVAPGETAEPEDTIGPEVESGTAEPVGDTDAGDVEEVVVAKEQDETQYSEAGEVADEPASTETPIELPVEREPKDQQYLQPDAETLIAAQDTTPTDTLPEQAVEDTATRTENHEGSDNPEPTHDNKDDVIVAEVIDEPVNTDKNNAPNMVDGEEIEPPAKPETTDHRGPKSEPRGPRPAGSADNRDTRPPRARPPVRKRGFGSKAWDLFLTATQVFDGAALNPLRVVLPKATVEQLGWMRYRVTIGNKTPQIVHAPRFMAGLMGRVQHAGATFHRRWWRTGGG